MKDPKRTEKVNAVFLIAFSSPAEDRYLTFEQNHTVWKTHTSVSKQSCFALCRPFKIEGYRLRHVEAFDVSMVACETENMETAIAAKNWLGLGDKSLLLGYQMTSDRSFDPLPAPYSKL